jgi:HrpA-like RNA helicase
VFLTGKNEIIYLKKRLSMALNNSKHHKDNDESSDDEAFFENIENSGETSSIPTKFKILPLYS